MATGSETSRITSNIFRARSGIVALAGLATAYSIYLLCTVPRHPSLDQQSVREDTNASGAELHRSNAVRRRRRSREHETQEDEDGLDLPRSPGWIDGDGDATDKSPDEEEQVDIQKSVLLDELVWAITKNRAKSDGRVHRSITCDVCSACPIVGVRYRCANCPDFDLCESCESRDVHHPTHVFYKIKVPAPWAGKIPTPVWYPGQPHMLPEELPLSTKRRLSSYTSQDLAAGPKLSEDKIGGLYTQFRNMANKRWDDDPHELGMAMDKNAFRECIIPQITPRDKNGVSLIYDRIFVFYDDNDDGLIGFEEFVLGTYHIHSKESEERQRRLFRGFDFDRDGFISRSDMLLIFRAYYDLTGENLTNHLFARRIGEDPDQVREGPDPHEFLHGGRPLASYYSRFPRQLAQFPRNARAGEGKAIDDTGDLVPTAPAIPTLLNTIDQGRNLISAEDVVIDAWITPLEELEAECLRMLNNVPVKFPETYNVMCLLNKRLFGKEVFFYKNKTWVKWRVARTEGNEVPRIVALFVPPNAVPKQLLDHVKRQKAVEVQETKLQMITASAVEYAEQYVQDLKAKREGHMVELNQKRSEFVPSEMQLSYPHAISTPAHPASNRGPNGTAKATKKTSSIDDTYPDDVQAIYTNSLQRSELVSRSEERSNSLRPLVGNAATQTMFDIVQKALNDMLDPFFEEIEDESRRARELEGHIELYHYHIEWFNKSAGTNLVTKKETWRGFPRGMINAHLNFLGEAIVIVTREADRYWRHKTAIDEHNAAFELIVDMIEEGDKSNINEAQRARLFQAFRQHINTTLVACLDDVTSLLEDHPKTPVEVDHSIYGEATPPKTDKEDADQTEDQGEDTDTKEDESSMPISSLGMTFIDLKWCLPPPPLAKPIPWPKDVPELSKKKVDTLSELSELALINVRRARLGHGGQMDLAQFKEKMLPEGNSDTGRSWISSWLEVVTF